MSKLYHSTRGLAPEIGIREVALAGLAPDGGLYLPKKWPHFSVNDIAAMRDASYTEIAFRVLRPFMQDALPGDVLRGIIEKSYAVFDAPQITPLKHFGGIDILELFHGPTLAFKDVALQFLGHTLDYFMQGSGKRITIIGATSGDTGSAAISALADRKNIDVFILYPAKGPSEIQRRQMTCVAAPNVHALAIDGSFDDCQAIVKAMFADGAMRDECNLTTVNSINLLRILAQIVYYFVAARDVAPHKPCFVVPTGNFGDIYAGYAAHKCGLPISKLVVASNSNDILTRFFATGKMEPRPVQGTLSPSMDIQVSSNFERLLFDLCDENAEQLRGLMQSKNGFSVTPAQLDKARQIFMAGSANDAETLATIAEFQKNHDYTLDPHTAVGVTVAQGLARTLPHPIVCLATAHPGKFPETVAKATGFAPQLQPKVASLIKGSERLISFPSNRQKIADFIRAHRLN
ncbi:MAG: threonine synthase [Alphaproteobacteria bacterium]|nr:threonine synthase [Alphaproteobacteria bacterium]